jgi:nuclear mRNA export protein PCID2/THP1
MNSFKFSLGDRNSFPNTKKILVLFIINELFRIYFKLNKLRLCTNLIKSIESIDYFEKFNKSEKVTFSYFAGRFFDWFNF